MISKEVRINLLVNYISLNKDFLQIAGIVYRHNYLLFLGIGTVRHQIYSSFIICC